MRPFPTSPSASPSGPAWRPGSALGLRAGTADLREQEVLRHVSRLLSTAEIASEMHISINTVKTHLTHINRKLATTRRAEAVRRGRQLESIWRHAARAPHIPKGHGRRRLDTRGPWWTEDSRSHQDAPVHPEPLWRIDFNQRITVSLWFLHGHLRGGRHSDSQSHHLAGRPGRRTDPRAAGLGGRPQHGGDLAGAIAAATLAFVAVVFATTLVAIQLAASQYSPRTVRIFIRSRVTRVTLGLFLATFVFSLIILVSNRASVASAKQFAPVVSVTTLLALTLATVFGFVGYLNGVVRLMRVQYLLEAIATDAGEPSRRTSAGVGLRRRRVSGTGPLTASPPLYRDSRGGLDARRGGPTAETTHQPCIPSSSERTV